MTIYYDLGKHRRSIKTKSADAQGWFDRGLIWCYAYNHEEAVRCLLIPVQAAHYNGMMSPAVTE